ncbi:spore germination protein PD [Paenibacillus prosopidis]|uniref:Spore germination protein PD n=2 Tax=Paenibacillus prosopidis TaxID=630520 RepID=A0A368W668_9BACL|nr:spore gernimation protein GerPD [Paenibacillus prosopidis]RCW51243.1 spore germination protein PD [Paenibacillus prosopidis]
MKMTIVNKSIKIGNLEIKGVGSSSVVLIGDTESITSSSYFDTPADSLIFSPHIPLKPVKKATYDNI